MGQRTCLQMFLICPRNINAGFLKSWSHLTFLVFLSCPCVNISLYFWILTVGLAANYRCSADLTTNYKATNPELFNQSACFWPKIVNKQTILVTCSTKDLNMLNWSKNSWKFGFTVSELVFGSGEEDTGKSLSEALILASTNPQYDRKIVHWITSSVHEYYKLRTCCAHKLSYCGLVDARISAPEKDLSV